MRTMKFEMWGCYPDCAKYALKHAIKLLNNEEDARIYQELLDKITRQNQKSYTLTLTEGEIDAFEFAFETVINETCEGKSESYIEYHHPMLLPYLGILENFRKTMPKTATE